MTIEYDPHGRNGIGIAQPESGKDYPLVSPSDDVRYLLADFYLAYDDPADYDDTVDPFTPPFKITWLYMEANGTENGPIDDFPDGVHAADVIITDADDRTVFDSTGADAEDRDWGTRLHIYCWETSTAVCRMVTHTKWSPDATPTPHEYDQYIAPESAELDGHVVRRMPKRVKSLTVVLTTVNDGPVDFIAGNNMAMSSLDPLVRKHRNVRQISMGAVPGAGTGIAPGCTPTALVIRRVNQIPPTAAGDFLLSATGCFYARQPAAIVQEVPRLSAVIPSMLQIGNDCSPCCACDDYVSTARYMNTVGAQYQTIGEQLQEYATTHADNVSRWDVAKSCIESRPLRLALQPQICPFLDVAAQFCNQSADCQTGPLILTIDFSATPDGDATATPGFGFITGLDHITGRRTGKTERYTIGGTWPVFTATWDTIEAFMAVSVRFRLKFGDCGVGGGDAPFVPQACLSATLAGVPISIAGSAVSVCKSATLNCPAVVDDIIDLAACVK